MKKTLTIIALAISCITFAQSDIPSGNLSDGYKMNRGTAIGTPFLMDEWQVGYGVFSNGEKSQPQLMNYDIHGNNIVYKTSESSNSIMTLQDDGFVGVIIKTEDGEILLSKIDGKKFDKSKNETRYYEIVDAPSSKVIVEYKKDLDDPNAHGWTSSNTNNQKAEYDLKTNYYVLNGDSKYEEVKLKNKSLIKTFKDKKDQIEKYIKNNNIDIETPKDMVAVVEYYHSII